MSEIHETIPVIEGDGHCDVSQMHQTIHVIDGEKQKKKVVVFFVDTFFSETMLLCI